MMSLIKTASILLLHMVLTLFTVSLAQNETALKNFAEIRDLKTSPIAYFAEQVIDVQTSFGEPVFQGEQMRMYTSFDEQGQQEEEINFSFDGSIANSLRFEYDEQGNKTQSATYNYLGTLLAVSKYSYDENGNQLEQVYYSSDGQMINKLRYKYDENNNQIEESGFNALGEANYLITYNYNEQGNKTEYNYTKLPLEDDDDTGSRAMARATPITTSAQFLPPYSPYGPPYAPPLPYAPYPYAPSPYFIPPPPYAPPLYSPEPYVPPILPYYYPPYALPNEYSYRFPLPYFEISSPNDSEENQNTPLAIPFATPLNTAQSPVFTYTPPPTTTTAEHTEDDELDTQITQIKYRYDENHNQIESLSYNKAEELVLQVLFEYDEHNNRIRIVNNHTDEEFDSQTQMNYDKHGNPIEISHFDFDSTLEFRHECAYEYDSYANWIAKSCLRYAEKFDEFQLDYDGLINEVIRRKIEYHNESKNKL